MGSGYGGRARSKPHAKPNLYVVGGMAKRNYANRVYVSFTRQNDGEAVAEGVNDSMVGDKREGCLTKRIRRKVYSERSKFLLPQESPACLAVRPTFPAGAAKNDVNGTESEITQC